MNFIGRGITVIASVSVLGFVVYAGGNAILAQAKPQTTKKPIQLAENTVKATPVATTAALTKEVTEFIPTTTAGKKVSKKCAACHTFTSGGKNKIGPNLFGIVNREIASQDGFKYSSSFIERKTNGFVWTKENIESYLKSPKKFIPGTKMAFGGLKKEKDLKNIITWLETLE